MSPTSLSFSSIKTNSLSLWLSSSGGGASFDPPLGWRERAGQELADAAARRCSQQRAAMRRGHHPAAEQCQRVGPRRTHRPAPRCPQRPHGGTADTSWLSLMICCVLATDCWCSSPINKLWCNRPLCYFGGTARLKETGGRLQLDHRGY